MTSATKPTSILYWNVDTQYDFMRNDESFEGKLHVPGARTIEGNLEKLTRHAERNSIHTINTADWHTHGSPEISDTPDHVNTFPTHCIMGSKGASFVPATEPSHPYTIEWDDETIDEERAKNSREIVIHKDEFDAFSGNSHTEKILDLKKPKKIYVYGVATNVCDDYAVMGLLRRGYEVSVVTDAIKELPGPVEHILAKWKENGATFTTTEEVIRYALIDEVTR